MHKKNLPLRSAVLMNQLNEMFEYLFLAIHSFRLLLEEQMPGLVIEIQDEVLHEVLEYLKTEIVIRGHYTGLSWQNSVR